MAYFVLVRLFRYRRRDHFEASHTAPNHASMTMTQAQAIIRTLGELEFPFTYEKALQFALFRTYGISTISSTLVKTGQFTRADTAAKRYADTAVLVASLIGRDWGSRHWVQAVARMNCLHALYRGHGITDEDMLYTLALFALEPLRWIHRYEWRELSRTERMAIGVFWSGMGQAMQISYAGLPSHDSGQGWRDGIQWLEELEEWAETYEARNMVPNPYNHETAEHTTVLLLWPIPQALKPLAKHAVCALMDDRLRESMIYPKPPGWVSCFVRGTLGLRRMLLRHASLPRPASRPVLQVSRDESPHGTFFLNYYTALPYYVKPTMFNRWGLDAWIRRLQGLAIPGDEGDKYSPHGFKVVNIGPPIGRAGQEAMEKKVEAVGRLTYPLE